jgi:trimeric autotransporter adhesin
MRIVETALVILSLFAWGEAWGESPAAVLPAGQVVGWGAGTALPETAASPYTAVTGVVKIAGQTLNDAVAVAAGMSHSLALRRDGTVVGWGWNDSGRAKGSGEGFGNGPVLIGGRVLSNVTAIAVGASYSLALKRDGSVVAWGTIDWPLGLSNVTAVAAGKRRDCALALKRDGTVVSFWSGAGLVPRGLNNIVAIAASGTDYWPPLALRRDGVVVVGLSGTKYEEAAPPPGLSNVVAIASGFNHYLALRSDGTVFGWGANGSGEATGTPAKTEQGTQSGLVALGGRVLSNVVEIAASDGLSLARKRDGTVAAWGRMGLLSPASVPAGLGNVVAISAGWGFCLAVTTNAVALGGK